MKTPFLYMGVRIYIIRLRVASSALSMTGISLRSKNGVKAGTIVSRIRVEKTRFDGVSTTGECLNFAPKAVRLGAESCLPWRANKSPHQNMVESIFIQEICHQAAEHGEYCILLGDFNHDEAANLTQFMWDADGELYDIDDINNNSGVDERSFSETRQKFLSHYV